MTQTFSAALLVLTLSPALLPGSSPTGPLLFPRLLNASPQNAADAKDDPDATARQARRKELFSRMDDLEDKLPADLQKKLLIIRMKLYTGYCSPRLAEELEEEIGKLPESESKSFQKQWDSVREHQEWPKSKRTEPEEKQ